MDSNISCFYSWSHRNRSVRNAFFHQRNKIWIVCGPADCKHGDRRRCLSTLGGHGTRNAQQHRTSANRHVCHAQRSGSAPHGDCHGHHIDLFVAPHLIRTMTVPGIAQKLHEKEGRAEISHEIVHKDPGLQFERTQLAWLRTSATLIVVLVFGIRIFVEEGNAWIVFSITLTSISLFIMLYRFSQISVINSTSCDSTLRLTNLITSIVIITESLVFLVSLWL